VRRLRLEPSHTHPRPLARRDRPPAPDFGADGNMWADEMARQIVARYAQSSRAAGCTPAEIEGLFQATGREATCLHRYREPD
jgi:hypothetical protein